MSKQTAFLQRKSLPAARALLTGGVGPVPDEEIEVADASGRSSAQAVSARHPAPHYRASAMDGLAVRAADTAAASDGPLLLRVLAPADDAPADGDPCCVPVDTGSLLPDWTDAVVRIEDASAAGDAGYRIKAPVVRGRDVRRAGEDIEEGELLLSPGARIRPWDIAALLATGTTRLRVRRRPRIALLATGSEVVEPQESAAAGSVIDYNSRMIAARIEEWGGSAHRLGIVADDEERLAAAIADAAGRFDAVCVIAGSSAGRKDFTIAALAAAGEVLAHGVDIAPGRPVALARLRGAGVAATPAIAVPGYPVSAIVVCEQLLAPLIAKLLGGAEAEAPRLRAQLLRKVPSRLGMEEFRRVCLVRRNDSSPVVALLPSGAGSVSSVSGAHGWLRIEPACEGLDAGSEVDVELLVSAAEVDSAFVIAGSPSPRSSALEQRLRDTDLRARVAHLRLGDVDALQAVARGEAHAAAVAAGAVVPAAMITVAAAGGCFAVAPGSHGEAVLKGLS